MKAAFRPLAALVLLAALPAAAAPTAVERGIWVQQGQHFQKTIVLDAAALADQGKRLAKGSYDVHFDSLSENKIRASFFQGGVKRGEVQGFVVIGGKTQAGPGGAALKFSDLGLGSQSPHQMRKAGGDKLELVVGLGTTHILIGLLVPAVKQGVIAIAPAQKN